MNNKSNRFAPLWMALCVVLGILVGTFYANHFSGNRLSIINSNGSKLNNLLHYVNDMYVDTVDMNDVESRMDELSIRDAIRDLGERERNILYLRFFSAERH